MKLKAGSLFTGIGGFDLGFECAGFETVWQVEKEPFCIAVLKTRFPNAERYYEITDCGGTHYGRKHKLRPVDIITAGVPCQDVSVAGKRAGLAGKRTGLFYEFARILREVRPTWFLFENVPGLLSSNQGRDFAEILRVLMVECGYGVCWRVLDSQFFGVAQRRRRVFVAGRFGKPCPAEVLFEPESGSGNFAQGQKTGQGIAHSVGGSSVSSSYRFDPNGEELIPVISGTISSSYGEGVGLADERNLISSIISVRLAQTGSNGWGISEDGRTHTLDSTGGDAVLCGTIGSQAVTLKEDGMSVPRPPPADNIYLTGVRRLTPTECEKLQGFPWAWTVPDNRSLGNAVTVQVAQWIAERIKHANQKT